MRSGWPPLRPVDRSYPLLQHLNPVARKPARVVVMGAHGFVGHAIASRLERDGVSVLRLGRGDVDLLISDASARLARLLRVEDVFVAVSALAPVRTAEMLRDNMIMATAMANAAASAPIAHLINISSDAVYADSTAPLTEASIKAPDTMHGAMHLAREIMFRNTVRAPLAMMRPTLIYGAADPHDGYGPNRFRRLANAGQAIELFGAGEERRDHVLIDDVAEIAARLCYWRSSGAVNVATGAVASFREIAEAAVGFAGTGVPINENPRQGPMPHGGYRAFDISTCRAAFPDFVFVPLADGLARAQREAVAAR
jgi:UDP-glucose 4-epimerase